MSSRDPNFFIARPIQGMQHMLRVAYQGNSSLVPLVADGVYGPNTVSAVTAFQRFYNLPATGVMNLETWEKLVEVYQKEGISQGPAAVVQPLMNPGQSIQIGESNYHVYLIQSILRVLGCAYQGIPPVPVNGSMDGPTVVAVRRFQKLAGLPATGHVDKMTWMHLCRQYTMAAGDGTGGGSHTRKKG